MTKTEREMKNAIIELSNAVEMLIQVVEQLGGGMIADNELASSRRWLAAAAKFGQQWIDEDSGVAQP